VRIAQIAPLYEAVPPAGYGGTERVIAALCDGLVGLGHDVTLFAAGSSTTRAQLEPIVPAPLRRRMSRQEMIEVAPHLHLRMLADVYRKAGEFILRHPEEFANAGYVKDTLAVLDLQIKDGLDGVTAEQVAALVIAYEPVWAIGTGRNATSAQAGEAHAHIRTRLRQWFGGDAAERCRVIYGGSVKPDNIRELIGEPDVDGALVGGASLDVKSFVDIVSRSRPG
jgi:hypothetical protein